MFTCNYSAEGTKIYNFLNEAIFDGILPDIEVWSIDSDDYIGAFSDDGKFIYMHDGTKFAYNHIEILLHEMCHVWQVHTNKNSGKIHGKEFKEIAKYVQYITGYKIKKYQNYFELTP